MEEKKSLHNLVLENKSKLHITQVTDVDTFDEGKIVLHESADKLRKKEKCSIDEIFRRKFYVR